MGDNPDFTVLKPWLAEGRRHPREAGQAEDRVIMLPVVRVENRTARTRELTDQDLYERAVAQAGVAEQMGDAERAYLDRVYTKQPPRADVKRGPLARDLRRAERCLRYLRRALERDEKGLHLEKAAVDIAYLEAVCALVFKALQEYGTGLGRDKSEAGS